MEERGLTQIYCGPRKGKTSVAIGQAVRAVGYGKRAIVIQFLKGKATTQLDISLSWNRIFVCSDSRRKTNIMRI